MNIQRQTSVISNFLYIEVFTQVPWTSIYPSFTVCTFSISYMFKNFSPFYIFFFNFKSCAIKKTIWFLLQVLWTIYEIYSYLSRNYWVVVWKQLKYSRIYRFQNISISDIYEWLQVRVLIRHSRLPAGNALWFCQNVFFFFFFFFSSSAAKVSGW